MSVSCGVSICARIDTWKTFRSSEINKLSSQLLGAGGDIFQSYFRKTIAAIIWWFRNFEAWWKQHNVSVRFQEPSYGQIHFKTRYPDNLWTLNGTQFMFSIMKSFNYIPLLLVRVISNFLIFLEDPVFYGHRKRRAPCTAIIVLL